MNNAELDPWEFGGRWTEDYMERRQRFIRRIVQTIIADNPTREDLEWHVDMTAAELEEENALPLGITQDEILTDFQEYWHGE